MKDRVPPIIRKNNVLDLIAQPKEGISADIKILNVQHNDQTPSLYCKLYTTQMQLLNEIIGYLLAHHLKLPQPKGYVLLLSSQEQTKYFGIQNPKTSTYPVWATEKIDGKSALFEFQQCTTALKKDLFQWVNLHQVISLDDWIGNEDRNIGNLIRTGAGKYQIIDHGDLFNGYPMRSPYLDKTQHGFNKLQAFCLKEQVGRRNKLKTQAYHHNRIGGYVANHQAALLNAQEEIFFWWDKLAKGRESKLYNYLYNRGKPHDHIVHTKYNLLPVWVILATLMTLI